MSTDAQISANRANSRFSTGPKTETGKATSSLNNFRHGLAGSFMILDWESHDEFDELAQALRDEHQPTTPTEILLVEAMTQHYWLRTRALRLQDACFHADNGILNPRNRRLMALYLRYQTTHERAFHKSLNQLLKLRQERRKTEIGFESQNQKKELHQWKVLHAQARAEHRVLLNRRLESPPTRPWEPTRAA